MHYHLHCVLSDRAREIQDELYTQTYSWTYNQPDKLEARRGTSG